MVNLRMVLWMAACGALAAIGAQQTRADAGPRAPVTPSSSSIKLPVSLLDFMRAGIEIPADGIWEAQSEEKLNDDAWLLVDQDSVSLAAAATLIAVGGTGKQDAQWAAHADWQGWAREVQKTALAIRAAGKAKDQEKLSAAADHLQEVCQTCHAKYRPETPSDGVARYPFYPKRVAAK